MCCGWCWVLLWLVGWLEFCGLLFVVEFCWFCWFWFCLLWVDWLFVGLFVVGLLFVGLLLVGLFWLDLLLLFGWFCLLDLLLCSVLKFGWLCVCLVVKWFVLWWFDLWFCVGVIRFEFFFGIRYLGWLLIRWCLFIVISVLWIIG